MYIHILWLVLEVFPLLVANSLGYETYEGSRPLALVYSLFQEVGHAHAQNAALEWFLSTPELGAMDAEAVE